jgi:anti-anti-sigma regulatory factor
VQSAPSQSRWYMRAARRATDVPGGIVCLRLNGELCADAADGLSDTVIARLTAASTRTETVVLDLSATATVDEQGRTALVSLQRRLADLTIRLRLVAPEPKVYATLENDGTGFGPDALHTSVRTAVLAAHADLPGPASATPILRMMLTQPPEPLSLDETPGSGASGWAVPAQRTHGRPS